MKRNYLLSFVCVALLYAQSLFAQNTAFTYQGALSDSGGAANGSYDLGFSLFCDGCTDPCCRITTNAVAVSNGLFAVTLDFGTGVFNGTAYWLEIAVRTNGDASFTTLAPRQELSPSPYAITAYNLSGVVGNAAISGTYSNAIAFSNPANVFTGDGSQLTGLNAASIAGVLALDQGGTGAGTGIAGLANLGGASLSGSNTFTGVNLLTHPANLFAGSFTGNGAGLTNLNADTLAGFSAASFWQLGGNAGTTPGMHFLGTTDDQPFELKTTGGVGINTNNPAGKALAVNGPVGIASTNTLEFGSDVLGKQANAGKIGYQTLTPGSLDVVGAGTNATSRRIKFWAEGGATFNGTGTNAILTLSNTVDEQTALILAAPFSTWRLGQNKPPDAPSAFDSFFIYQQSAGATRLLVTAAGLVGLNTNNPVYPLHLGNGAYCTAGGQWTSVSDRNAKADFTPIQPKDMLAKVAALPITQWRYKAETNGVRHLGPMAQDFHAAFGLGDSEKAIGDVDGNGVALAAIQGLNLVILEKDAEIRALREKSLQTEQRLEALETYVRATQNR